MRVPRTIIVATCFLVIGCDTSQEPFDVNVPSIVEKSILFHGGNIYEHSKITMTISSLSGSFDVETARIGGNFDYLVTGTLGGNGRERQVRLTNDTVEEWRDGEPLELKAPAEARARAYVDARVFFALLPYSLQGSDLHFHDLGLETWFGRNLHKVKVSFTPGTSNDANDRYMFWFDPDTGRMEQFGYDFSGGLRFRKGIEFERVGGILFSTQENYAIDGGRVPVTTLSQEYVSENMDLRSIVVISNVTVEPL